MGLSKFGKANRLRANALSAFQGAVDGLLEANRLLSEAGDEASAKAALLRLEAASFENNAAIFEAEAAENQDRIDRILSLIA